MLKEHIDEFIRGYMVAAVWTSTHTASENDDPVPIDSLDPEPEWSEEAIKDIKKNCIDFMESNEADLKLYVAEIPYDPTQGTPYDYAGHDYWLTRNGCGVGYWDRGLGELGKRLTEACDSYGSQDLEVGDHGKLYII